MSNYYTKQEAKVRIAHELMKMGWNVEGYHADQSDSMQDIWNPAHWYGVATKNGYVLVVDNRYDAKATEITKYNPAGNLSLDDREKIAKLEAMTIERGCTESEEENAKKLIEKIQSKTLGQAQYEVVGYTTAHMGNPKGSIWHIEKDGKIYDKGNGLTKFSELPEEYEFDINKMEYTDRYKQVWTRDDENGCRVLEDRILPDETKKIINDFKALILRFERVVNGMNSCGDGTKETEQKAQEQNEKTGFEKVTVTEYKEEIKVNEVEKPTEIKEGMYFILKTGFNHGCSKGTIYKVNSVKENPFNHKYYIDANRMNRKLTKVLTGNATTANSFDVELSRLTEWIEKGSISIVELVTVSTPYEVEKWVKIDKSKNTYNTTKKTEQEENKTETVTEQQEQTNGTILNHEITITADIDTRDNSSLWVVKIVDKLSPEEYKKVAEQFKNLKGYYSKFKHGFIFKYDPTEALKPETKTATEQQAENITEEVSETEKSCSDIAENLLDMGTTFITELGITGQEAKTNEQYKRMIESYIKNNNINITDEVISYLKSNNYTNLVEVLEEITSPYWQPEIKDGFIYDCHFKEWDIPMTEIQEAVTALNIPFIDMGCKIGFEGLTAEQARQVKEISDINSSIFWIDSEIPVSEGNSAIDEEIQNPVVTEAEETTNNIIDIEDYKNNNAEVTQEMQGNSEDFNIDDILNQFENIEINNNSHISKDDEEFCVEQERLYNEFIKFSDDYLHYLKDNFVANKYFNSLSLETEMNKTRESKKSSFISNIVNYFSKEYKVTLTSDNIISKYGFDVTYNNIVDEIIEQLEGHSFRDKAEKELKEKLKEVFKYAKPVVKGNKLSFDLYIATYDSIFKRYEISWNNIEKANSLFSAMTYFDMGKPEPDTQLTNVFNRNSGEDTLFSKLDLKFNKIESIKFYKNQRIDIEFKNNQYARQFAKEYCGYIEKAS